MLQFRTAVAPLLLVVATPAFAQDADPLHFFEGRTENEGTAKVIFHKPYKTHTLGRGRIERDGSLTLVQRVDDEGKAPHVRRWHVRPSGPDRYTGSFSDADGPVTIQKVGNRYRFSFRMKGNLNVEQWLTPMAGGTSARCLVKVRKFGLTVGTSECTIRKLAEK
jgi:hypothetical protein